jgi:hypothetical protein
MDVGSWEMMSKRLNARCYYSRGTETNGSTYNDISSETVIVPDNARIEVVDQELPFKTTTWKGLWIVKIIRYSLTTNGWEVKKDMVIAPYTHKGHQF